MRTRRASAPSTMHPPSSAKPGAANLSANVLLIIVFLLISIGLSIGQSELPGNVQTIATDSAANLALALAISDHIKRNKSS